jgi:hypothetical protein
MHGARRISDDFIQRGGFYVTVKLRFEISANKDVSMRKVDAPHLSTR